MGFSLRCAIAKADSPDEAARLHDRIAAAFPELDARVFHTPFLGVICGIELSGVDEVSESLVFALEEGLREFSARFPEKPWAYVDVDGHGSTCLYDGFIAQAGELGRRLGGASERGHLELMEHLGATGLEGDFAPFHSGFLRGHDSREGPSHEAILGLVQGQLEHLPIESLRLKLPLALAFPWALRSTGARTLSLEAGDQQLVLSVSVDGARLRVAGHSHLPPEEAKTTLADLVASLEDCGCGLTLSLLTLDRVLLHRWGSSP